MLIDGEKALIRFGVVGVNTSHAGVFARIFNGGEGRQPALQGARIVAVWGEPEGDARALVAAHDIPALVEDPTEMIGSIDAVLILDDTGGGAVQSPLVPPLYVVGFSLVFSYLNAVGM